MIHGAYQLVIDVLCDLEGHVNYQRHQALKSLHLVIAMNVLKCEGILLYIYITRISGGSKLMVCSICLLCHVS